MVLRAKNEARFLERTSMGLNDFQAIADEIQRTNFQDTHEHLPTEESRLRHKKAGQLDFSYLLSHYLDSDLISAGLDEASFQKFLSPEVEHKDKWQLIEPYIHYIANTGYGQCLRRTLSTLYGVDDLSMNSLEFVTEKLREQTKPGFYKSILREVCRIDHVQVNCLDSSVIRIAEEDKSLISQDLNTLRIASRWEIEVIEQESGTSVDSIQSIHNAISIIFDRYSESAISVKDPSAYWRKLRFENVSDSEANEILKKYLKDPESISNEEYDAVGSNLFRYAVRNASEFDLPIKIHTGYLAGANHMDLAHVASNLRDLQLLITDFPQARFVLMHISYPMQNELLALTKHFSNVFVDMCWSWIVNPLAASQFLAQFLVSAPSNKVFTFGGDFIPVELITGHAEMARDGITRSLSWLCDEGQLKRKDALALVPQLMATNAANFFKLPDFS